MTNPYIPAKDADFSNWSANFATVIAAAPASYGLTATDATAISLADSTFQTAYAAAINPATRTSVTVAAKDTAKAATLVTERNYAQIIGANAGVSAGAKTAAGLTVRATGRTAIPAPTTVPGLALNSMIAGQMNIGFADTLTPASKKKPFGAIQMLVSYQANYTGTADIDLATCGPIVTKSPFFFVPPAGMSGKNIAIWGKWCTRTGLVGPASTPITAIIP